MSIAVPIILFILMAGVCIFMDIRGWKDFRHLYWLISVITGVVGNISAAAISASRNPMLTSSTFSTPNAADIRPSTTQEMA